MEYIKISGGRKLKGEIDIQGSKNSALPILAATLLNNHENIIHNCPAIEDVSAAIEILKIFGCDVRRCNDTIFVNSENAKYEKIPEILVKKMRSSVMFAGSILARFKKCVLAQPGGCNIGNRPIDMHISAFKMLGANIKSVDDEYEISVPKQLNGNLKLPFPSVGVTENIMLLCAGIPSDVTVENVAKEPEIVDLANFLNNMGAEIYGAGTSSMRIVGKKIKKGVEHKIIPDRIACSTYLLGTCACGGECVLHKANHKHIFKVCEFAKSIGANIKEYDEVISLNSDRNLKGFEISADVYPFFPTDAQPFAAVCASVAQGTSVIKDNVFPERFKYLDSFKTFGADVSKGDYGIKIKGRDKLHGAKVFAEELRGGASLVLMGLCAEGETYIGNTQYIRRGYADIVGDFYMLGGDITSINDNEKIQNNQN